MYEGKSIAVVIPAHNEEKLIGQVLDTMPDFVDLLVVVDDASTDQTKVRAEAYKKRLDKTLVVLSHAENQGVGGAIITGYKYALAQEMDVVAVMAGDAQMDPADLDRVIAPVARGEAEYVKGNRLFRKESWQMIPHYRYLGNAVLSLFTKIASGYWHIADSQSGYTAIARIALERLDLDQIYKRYGMPNDLLVKLNIHNFRVRDVSIRPVYNVGEVSGIRLRKVIPVISWLLLYGFLWRLKEKYVLRDFHPLVFFYCSAFLLIPTGTLFGAYLLAFRLFMGHVAPTSALFAAFLIISGFQSLFFAMWFDMDYNKNLR